MLGYGGRPGAGDLDRIFRGQRHSELRRTTRDEPDYDKLMTWRLGILKEHGLGLKEIQDTIAKIDPAPGAKAFLDEPGTTQVIILSDTLRNSPSL